MRRRAPEGGTFPRMIPVERLRDLTLEDSPSPGRHAHLSAASGVVRKGDFLYVVGDDELHLAVFRASSPAPGALVPIFEERLPDDEGERKAHKPDFEAITDLPPFPGHPHGGLLGLGSGRSERLDRGFFWSLEEDGSLRGDALEVALGPVYRLLSDYVLELNVEGAAVVGDRLWMLQRGNSDLGRNIVAELSLEEVLESLRSDLAVDTNELINVRAYDLGELNGVELTFSDAAPLPEGGLVFTASAEGTPNSYEDDEVQGSAVGIIGPDGSLGRIEPVTGAYKIEGVEAAPSDDGIDLLMVCDADDPEVASPLLAARMPR